MKITLTEDQLPFNFFESIHLNYEEVIIKQIQKNKSLSYSSSVEFFEKHNTDLIDQLYELRDNQVISDCWEEDREVDESIGTFGYSVYEIENIDEIKNKLEYEIISLLNEVLKDIDEQFEKNKPKK